MINTAGGITGGDALEINAAAREGSKLVLTTQAAERAYAAQVGSVGRLVTELKVAAGAQLHWLPQELILYDRCALDRSLRIEMADDAGLLMVEPVLLGRAAMGERLTKVHFRDRVRITRGGVPVYLDGLDLTGDAARHMQRAAIADGAGAMASVIHTGPEAGAQARLAEVRALLPQSCGASLLPGGILTARLLAPDGHALRQTLVPLLRLLGGSLPKSWMT